MLEADGEVKNYSTRTLTAEVAAERPVFIALVVMFAFGRRPVKLRNPVADFAYSRAVVGAGCGNHAGRGHRLDLRLGHACHPSAQFALAGICDRVHRHRDGLSHSDSDAYRQEVSRYGRAK